MTLQEAIEEVKRCAAMKGKFKYNDPEPSLSAVACILNAVVKGELK